MNVENNLKTLPMLGEQNAPMERAADTEITHYHNDKYEVETVAVPRSALAKAVLIGSAHHPTFIEVSPALGHESVVSGSAGDRGLAGSQRANAEIESASANSPLATISGSNDNSGSNDIGSTQTKDEQIADILSDFVGDFNNMGQDVGLGTDDLDSIQALSEVVASITLNDYRVTLSQIPPDTELQDYTEDQIEAYNQLHKAFMQTHGDHILEHHRMWHFENGSGGTTGEGSGESFLMMHRQMALDFENFVNAGMSDGNWQVPELDPTRPLPHNLGQASAINPEWRDRLGNDPGVERPDFLIIGGNSVFPFVLDGKAHRGLEDFTSLDDLGRAIGESYHSGVHSNLGGTMSSMNSPADPTFYAWHGELDGVVKEWLTTENGQAWAEDNPGIASMW